MVIAERIQFLVVIAERIQFLVVIAECIQFFAVIAEHMQFVRLLLNAYSFLQLSLNTSIFKGKDFWQLTIFSENFGKTRSSSNRGVSNDSQNKNSIQQKQI